MLRASCLPFLIGECECESRSGFMEDVGRLGFDNRSCVAGRLCCGTASRADCAVELRREPFVCGAASRAVSAELSREPLALRGCVAGRLCWGAASRADCADKLSRLQPTGPCHQFQLVGGRGVIFSLGARRSAQPASAGLEERPASAAGSAPQDRLKPVRRSVNHSIWIDPSAQRAPAMQQQQARDGSATRSARRLNHPNTVAALPPGPLGGPTARTASRTVRRTRGAAKRAIEEKHRED